MVSLTTPVSVRNIQKYQVLDFRIVKGEVTLQVLSGGSPACQKTYVFGLSDAASGSNGLRVEANPQSWDDTIQPVSGVGVANSLANAIAAYRGAATHSLGLKALELRGVTDGWLSAEFAGT